MTSVLIKNCGPATSIQDYGRFGWQRFGISNSGSADRLALAAANALVGNAPGVPAIEFALLGGALEIVGGRARLALAGADMPLRIEGHAIDHHASFLLEPGQILQIGTAQAGVYAILAAEGGFEIATQLGSASLHARAAIGGLRGAPLAPGDDLPLAMSDTTPRGESNMDALSLSRAAPLRVVLGPQDDYFTPAGRQTFLGSEYRVTTQADRMGVRLTGPRIEHAKGFNIVSDGIVSGSIQIPGSGEPIVMLADRQTTGGYPKIATVITSDLRLLAQRRHGESIRFAAVTIEQAQQIAREARADMDALPNQCRPVVRGLPGSDELLAMNLAGSAVSASDPTTWL